MTKDETKEDLKLTLLYQIEKLRSGVSSFEQFAKIAKDKIYPYEVVVECAKVLSSKGELFDYFKPVDENEQLTVFLILYNILRPNLKKVPYSTSRLNLKEQTEFESRYIGSLLESYHKGEIDESFALKRALHLYEQEFLTYSEYR